MHFQYKNMIMYTNSYYIKMTSNSFLKYEIDVHKIMAIYILTHLQGSSFLFNTKV